MRSLRRILIVLVVVAAVTALVALMLPQAVLVEAGRVVRGSFELAVEEDCKTRVRERYVVSAPLQGRLLRIELHAGDGVERGDLLATLFPTPPPLIDARSREELRARVSAAEAARERAEAELARTRVELEEARRELARAQELAREKVMSPKELESRQFAAEARGKAVTAAEFELDVTVHVLEMARAVLSQVREEPCFGVEPWEIRSPVQGRILRVLNESEGVVAAGTPLLELGDPDDLEVVVDLLTSDAVRAAPGARVTIDGWGGVPLDGRVRIVEPGAFTKVSALGVEEQRVNVLIDIGPRSERAAIVEEGLGEGDLVLVYSGDEIADGVRVSERAG